MINCLAQCWYSDTDDHVDTDDCADCGVQPPGGLVDIKHAASLHIIDEYTVSKKLIRIS